MTEGPLVTRRRLLLGAASVVAIGAAGRIATLDSSTSPEGDPQPPCEPQREIVFGSSAATWQLSDADYRRLFVREAEMLFTEDDLLWYRLRPKPDSVLDFKYADQIIEFAEQHGMLVFAAHLVWDEGFGEGWTEDDLWGMDEQTARKVLFDTVERTVKRYRGRVAAWSVVNEAIGTEGVRGLRTDVPWYETIGPFYVAESFDIAHAADPDALLVLNEFGYETVNEYGDRPDDKQRATLRVVDRLLDDDVPVHALGVQAHLPADKFAERFDPVAYRRFLSEIASRGLKILITELDVLDDGLPADRRIRDRVVADAYLRYLEATLQEPAVAAVITFGLSDRYTWLQEDYPRKDGAPRRPLPFSEGLRAKPAHHALEHALETAPPRCQLWEGVGSGNRQEFAAG
ncbi:MAG: endo-1,4-beta-xylanase [Actinobacteria bacterium]|nr:endo-1,4-beta-xylanase [Actinomycetota bacterium]MDQ3532392.1 endo-1,4-beta-xylanase [Actinomycetota bacterium]